MTTSPSRFVSVLAACAISPFVTAAPAPRAPVPLAEAQKIADEYLAKMTLEEKVTILHADHLYSVAGVKRLGIPTFRPYDGPCAVRPELTDGCAYAFAGRTDDCAIALPPLSAVAATWDPEMSRIFGETYGSEQRARGKDVGLGPSINILRTPLNGRTFEYMGEDPYLTSRMVVPVIQGIQTQDVGACVKHFVANNQELDRQGVNVTMDERTLREIYLPGFEAAIKEGGSLTLMGAYNKFRGEWCCESSPLLNGILRKEWGFDGAVISDWGGVHDMTRGALGGCDLEMGRYGNGAFFSHLPGAVKSGKIPAALVDEKARRMLTLMARLRILGPDAANRNKGELDTPAHREAARKIASESVVLLKNDSGVLPLDAKKLKKVVVFGRNADMESCTGGGSGEGKPPYEITALEGLRSRLGAGVDVEYVREGGQAETFSQIPASCIATMDTVAMVKGWEAEYFNNIKFEGAPALKKFEGRLDFDWKGQSPFAGIKAQHFSARWKAKIVAPETGEYTLRMGNDDGARLTVDGKPVITSWREAGVTPETAKLKLEAGKTYEFAVEYFQTTGTSAFFLDWRTPSESAGPAGSPLAKKLREADAVIVFTGTDHNLETEGSDRKNIKLPAGQDALVESVLAAAPRAVVINQSGAPVEMPWVAKAPTLLQFWFAGQEGGAALAGILCGDTAPSGKLPCTFPVKLADSPAHTNGEYRAGHVNYAEGLLVGYRWYDAKKIAPLFPFGHGLSYTTFTYGTPTLPSAPDADGIVTVSLPVTNSGKLAGTEVVQLYLHEVAPKVMRPEQELKGFARVVLAPGETKLARFTLTPRDFSYWSVEAKGWKADPGAYEIRLGSSSRDIRAKAEVRLK
jgi:beta-glucosidase